MPQRPAEYICRSIHLQNGAPSWEIQEFERASLISKREAQYKIEQLLLKGREVSSHLWWAADVLQPPSKIVSPVHCPSPLLPVLFPGFTWGAPRNSYVDLPPMPPLELPPAETAMPTNGSSQAAESAPGSTADHPMANSRIDFAQEQEEVTANSNAEPGEAMVNSDAEKEGEVEGEGAKLKVAIEKAKTWRWAFTTYDKAPDASLVTKHVMKQLGVGNHLAGRVLRALGFERKPRCGRQLWRNEATLEFVRL